MSNQNSLAYSRSLYLRQHASNPVRWLPWVESSLIQAQKEQKLMIVSIGYAACHWCHVMERECFTDEAVAAIMNQHFICIKVDREEHPEVDMVYLEAVERMCGSGGWPLNCICMPDGKPIYGGTYFPKNEWLNLLQEMIQLVSKQPQDAHRQAVMIAKQLEKSETATLKPISLNKTLAEEIFRQWEKKLDFEHGGNVYVPKFPLPANWLYLLRYGVLSHSSKAIDIVKTTLDSMLSGGLYDHLGGGFARYSADGYWFAPHFEKMLYDNAQLILLYAEAYQFFKNTDYQEIAEKTIAFIQQNLKLPSGYASALDADSENQEGRYYVWKYTEIQDALGELTHTACKYYGCSETGNWEAEKNILAPRYSDSAMAQELAITESSWKLLKNQINQKLLEARLKRTPPAIDNKAVTAWNGLFISALIKSYQSFGDEKHLYEAMSLAETITENASKDFQIFRFPITGSHDIPGTLDDYAFLIRAFLDLYQATFEGYYLEQANNWLLYVNTHFWDEATGFYWFSEAATPHLVARKQEIRDTAIPASNAEMAHNLLDLAAFMDTAAFASRAREMLQKIASHISHFPPFYARWATLLLRCLYPNFQVSVIGKDALPQLQKIWKHFIPNIIYSGSCQKSFYPMLRNKFVLNKTLIYLCQDNTCLEPEENPASIIQKIQANLHLCNS